MEYSSSQQTPPSFPSPQTPPYPFMQYPLPSLPLFPWLDTQDLQADSSGHLLLRGGLVGKEGMCSSTPSLQTTSASCGNMVGSERGSFACGHGYSSGGEEIHESVQTWSNNLPVSTPRSCVTDFSSNVVDFANTKMEGRHPKPDHSCKCNCSGTTSSSKKARVRSSLWAQSAFKVRKEKVGDRITALHRLVSPFGKTDTASVLLEACGYIKLLHSQIQALSSPYFSDNAPSNPRSSHLDVGSGSKKDLRSKGLCLVPISCAMAVEINDHITDQCWSPPMLFR